MSEKKNKISKFKRWVLLGALFVFGVQIVAVPLLLVPQQANAIMGVGDVTFTTIVSNIWGDLKDAISKAVTTAANVAFRNMIRNFVNAFAYNMAVEVATGKKGQQPLFPTQPKELLKQTADAAAGYFLDSVARDWSTGRCDGYGASDDNKCSQDSTCQPSLLLCPKGAVPQVCSNEEKKAGTCFTECASGLNAKAFCIARGCRTIQCNKNEECPPWGMAGYPADDPRFEGMEFPPRPAAAQCMKDFTLCEPQDLTVKVKLVAWAEKQTFGVPEITSKCPLSKIVDNYEKYAKAFEEDYEKLKEQGVGESFGDLLSGNKDRFFLAEITKTFNPEATEMGAYLSIIEGTKQKAAEEAKKIEFKKLMEGELDPVETTITGEKKTPAVFIEQAQQSVFDMSGKEVLHQTGSMIADAIGTFTNTLSSKLLDRLINEGWNPFAGKKGTTGTTGLLSDVFGGSAPGITAAKILFADLQRTNYSVGGSVDVLDNISSCPDSENISSDTCVVDSRFRTAIENNMTVQDALNEGLLDGTKPFGFTSTGAEPEYYNGYPYRSLVILRKYRIIPVGWELAAKYIRDFASGTYTLSSLVSEYNNPDSPFYRLVDPNWVLKSPELYCKRKGAGERLLTSEVLRAEDTNEDNDINLYDAASAYIQRDTEYCADEQMCLAENADGSCKKFGYCVEEQPVWKFNGEGCEAQYNSCQTFNTPDGSQVSYLKDTIDADGCNVGNAGCNWYCDNWNPNISEFVCANINPVSPYNRKVIFNSNVEDCDASAEGCHQFIAHQDSGANLIWQNADLEAFDPEPGASNTDGQKDTSQPDDFYIFIDGGGWDGANYCGLRSFAVSDAYKGFTAARIKTYSNCAGSSAAPYFNGRYLQPVMVDAAYLTDSRAFTFSFYAKKVNSACTGGPLTLDVYRYIKWDGAPQEMDEYKVDFDIGSTWTRYTASVTFKNIPPNEWYLLGLPTDVIKKLIFASFIQQENEPCELIIDNIQIEEGTMSDFKIYEDNPKTHMKFMAPEMYGCTGNPETDNAICSTFAQTCSANEVGCEAYTSVSSGRVITGIISNPESCDLNNPASCDQCPAEYVGCQAYREMPITRTPRRPVRDPVSFVADTGEECPASAVGCEEYTNIEEVNLGGEGREYYSYIRMCVDEDDDKLRPYYTWEGSEEFGFQLKEYILLISDDVGDNGPCTNIAPENPAIPPALNWPNCVDGEVFDENGDGIDEDHPKATCLESEVGINPDCTEFYDEDGVRYYRLKSRVIYGSSDCKSFRNSIDGEDIIYHMIPDQGVRCSASYAGCREYKGNAGDNVRVVYTDNFEGGSVSPWIGNAVYSNESINVGGHSMLVNNNAAIPDAADALGINNNTSYIISFWAKGATADTPISFAFNTFPALIFPGQAAASAGDWKMYAIGPLYIPAGTDLTGVQLQVSAPSAFYIDNVIIREAYDNVYYIKDSYTECSGYENCDEYLDRGNNIHYLKSFTRLCQDDKVGCELFIDTNNTDKLSDEYYTLWNSPEYLRGDVDNDKDVDADDVIYLYAYLGGGPPPPLLEKADIDDDGDIDKDDAIYLHNFLSDNGPSPIPRYETKPVTNYIPSDSYRFLVNDPGKHCSSADEGCRRFGEPVFDVDGSISSFNHVYLRNQPDEYSNIWCTWERVGCEQYTTAGGSTLFFKDPSYKTCDYTKVPGQDMPGWYTNGTIEGLPNCPVTDGVCIKGHNKGQACRVALDNEEFNDCDEWPFPDPDNGCVPRENIVAQPSIGRTGTCPSAASGCTEYRDPENPVDYTDPENPISCDITLADGGGDEVNTLDCDSYYYLSAGIDQSSCNGMVDRPSGCLLFSDASKDDITWSSSGTEDSDIPALCLVPPAGAKFIRGDANSSGSIDIDDAVFLINFIGGGGPAPVPLAVADADTDGNVDMDDVLFLQNYIGGGGPAPYPPIIISDCDANTIVKVRRDRECRRWLECGDFIRVTDANGGKKDLCTSRYLCEEMDESSGVCTKPVEFEDFERVNQTYTMPSFADKIKNYSGMTVTGLEWGNRCINNQNISCDQTDPFSCRKCDGGINEGGACLVDADCPPASTCVDNGPCSDPQIIEGYMSYQAMEQMGTISPIGKLVEDGDFADGDYFKNSELNKILSSVDSGGEPDGPEEINIESVRPRYAPGDWSGRQLPIDCEVTDTCNTGAGVFWTEESDEGQLPSLKNNLDENNVGHIVADGEYTGASYDLEGNLFAGESYVVSLKARTADSGRVDDVVYIQIDYIHKDGTSLQEYLYVGHFNPTTTWGEYVFGPFLAGLDENGDPLSYQSANLDFLYAYKGTGAQLKPFEFFVDDVSMLPALEIQETKCVHGPDDGAYCRAEWEGRCLAGANEGELCSADTECPGSQCGDCLDSVGPGESASYCYTTNMIARECRLYPNSTAPTCIYKDENNTTYQGWQGFCIEHDPRNPNYCLTWWPVDLLRGESDAFGDLVELDNYRGRTPLYMCTAGDNNYNLDIDGVHRFTNAYILSDADALQKSGHGSCNDINFQASGTTNEKLYNEDFLYRRPMHTRISAMSGTSEGDEACQMSGNIPFNNGAWRGISLARDCSDDEGCTIINTNRAADPEDKFYLWEIDKINVVMNRWSHSDWNCGRTATEEGPSIFTLDHNSDCSGGGICWSGSWTCLGNTISLSVKFNVDNAVTSYDIYAYDGNNGGGAWVMPIFHLREGCMEVAKVVDEDGDSKAWATRLKSGSSYLSEPFFPSPDPPDNGPLKYGYETDYRPFGGMLVNYELDPTEWDGKPLESEEWGAEKQPLYIESPLPGHDSDQLRGGNPYAMGRDMDQTGFGTMCIGGGTKHGDDCTSTFPDCCEGVTQQDIDNNSCSGNQGICVGPQVPTGGHLCYDWVNCRGDAIVKLRSLFAAPTSGQDGWQYQKNIMQYDQYINMTQSWDSDYRNMSLCPVQSGEITRPLDPNQEYCGVPPVIDNILAGSTEGSMASAPQIIDLPSNGGAIFLSFTFTGDRDQVPLKYIEVDWADGLQPYPLDGKFASGTLFTSHTYNWRNPPLPGENIKIKVRDNWDWCADLRGGNCTASDCRFDSWNPGGDCDYVDTGVTVTLTGG